MAVRPPNIQIRLEDLAFDLAADRESPRAAQSLRRRHAPLAEPAEQLKLLNRIPLRAEFHALAPQLAPARLEVFQVNLGKLCNMTCRHCHVDAGPDRTDAMMDDETVEQVIAAIRTSGAHTADLTGGAPELHPRFRDVVQAALDDGKNVRERCSLTAWLLLRHAC